MRLKRKGLKLLALFLGLSLVAAACGSDDDEGNADNTDGTETPADTAAGGEFVDLGTIVGDPLEHIDPALNTTLDGFQITNALYDGLTEIDFSDPENPELKGLVAESWEPNADATEFVFTLKEGHTFSNGDPVLPSSFKLAWERASDPDFAGDYSYLFNFLVGGAEKLAGEAEEISGVVADDDAMTLTTQLTAPYANWPTVAGFQLFFPMPSDVETLDDQTTWENGLMIGNGPFQLDAARTDTEIVLVKNDSWAGDQNGEKWEDRLEKITFLTQADPDTAYTAFEAGEGDNASVPPSRWGEAKENHANTIEQALGTRYFELKWDNPAIGGPENVKFREAIMLAINREEISEAIYDGTNAVATSLIPPGIPGYTEGICEFCKYDPAGAEAALAEWTDAGHSQTEPLKIQLNADAGHEPVVQIIIDNLSEVGIEAVADPFPGETYFTQLGEGACIMCRSGWYADYPTADNFTYDLFHSDAIGGNNHGSYSNPEFDALIDEAKSTTDLEAANELYAQAEDILLNQDIGVVPYLYYSLDYVYDGEKVASFPVNKLGLILWEQVALKA
ncbi:MAG: ABC transporter substrate-binding protein [Acidimicrobiales bacterium]